MEKMFYTPEEAAPYLGISPVNIRHYMREGVLDLGLVIPPTSDRKSYIYRIYPQKLERVLGGKIEYEEKHK